jgi:hypothetical protein
MRRSKARHPAALLIDQHRRIRAAGRGAQLTDEAPQLRRPDAVAGEQDEAEGRARRQQGALLGPERRPGDPDDRRGRSPAGRVSGG